MKILQIAKNKHILIQACNENILAHWGLIRLEWGNYPIGNIELFDSAISCVFLKTQIHLIHLWDVSMKSHSRFSDFWPSSWIC